MQNAVEHNGLAVTVTPLGLYHANGDFVPAAALVAVCSWCVPQERSVYISGFGYQITHGICAACAVRFAGAAGEVSNPTVIPTEIPAAAALR